MAGHEHHVKSQIHVETLYGGTDVGVLYSVQRAGIARHAKSELAEGVSGEPPPGQRHVLGTGEPFDGQLHERGRGDRSRVGGRYDNMENDRAE